MKGVLILAAVAEAITGVALVLAPSLVVHRRIESARVPQIVAA